MQHQQIKTSPEFIRSRDLLRTGPYLPKPMKDFGIKPLTPCSKPACGVYFLVLRNIVVYIGSSDNILLRAGQHCGQKQFDRVCWIETSPDERLQVEAEWISSLRPKLNGWTDNHGIRRYSHPLVDDHVAAKEPAPAPAPDRPTAAGNAAPRRILRLPMVMERVGMGRTTIYELESAGLFPKRVKLSTRAVGWVESEVESWLRAKIDAENVTQVTRKEK